MRAYALLANGQMVSVSVARGNVLAKRTLGPRARAATAYPMLARLRDTVYALTPRLGGQSLVLLDAADLAERARITLGDGEFTAIEPARSGAVHVLGARAGTPILVTVVDGIPRPPLALRPTAGRVVDAALSSDERRLAVSYDGAGADVIDLMTGTREPCAAEQGDSVCLAQVRGDVEFTGSALIGTTGSVSLALYQRGIAEPRAVRTGLPRNRLMALARDRASGLVVAAAPCTATRAFSVMDLNQGSARVYRTACGDAVAASGRVAVIGTRSSNRIRAGVSLVDLRTGAQLRFVKTTSPLAVAL